MKVESELFDKFVERVVSAVNAHKVEFGEDPAGVQVPLPKQIIIHGVPVQFYLGNEFYTMSLTGKIVHHKFHEHLK